MGDPATDRAGVARSAADRLEALGAEGVRACRVLVGFDGFIDSIIRVVSSRRSMAPTDFERIATIPEFATRAAAAAGKSANIELFVEEDRFGGNGPLMAGAIGRLGASVTFIGAVGTPEHPTSLHPVYEPFAQRCDRVIPVAPPAQTDALEFDDGKIMLGKPQNVQVVTWDHLKQTVGLDAITEHVRAARLIGIVNWTLCGGVESIWQGLIDEVFPRLDGDRSKSVYIDLSDPAKRSDGDLSRALGLLRTLNGHARVSLGLNHSEGERIARVAGAPAFDDAHNRSQRAVFTEAASAIRESLGLDCVVVHPREGAAGATADGDATWFEGPFTRSPRISTGAGDHFNGGFALARELGLGLGESLAVGCGVSGAYVRDALSPSLDRLVGFLRDLPIPEPAG